ncbi:MAG: DUF4254 domain-containing protein [Crocinitomicaceae bacterium]|jgi:hypothetical protein|nr:DUF4254 domain-containing protein [Crocinitomicaceae bacterium]MBT5404180.1 DUF4254 domain-containing protein [Crocinitomicaceae bacterium]MBT6029759.1 DUF4254 domain-containing protein [Crocinitomicaceae bacterium]MBT6515827.1 DUF4254 domain-containing protein [Crocinitomicaceae bacterium]
MKATVCISIFNQVISDYHQQDNVDTVIEIPFHENTLEALLYKKCWIDTVQWHLEDIIRDPQIDNANGISIKRRIDQSNQDRTDLVEQIDDWINNELASIQPLETARLNTESIAWVLDRISILCLKLFHMKEQTERDEADETHLNKCKLKYSVLLEQEKDMIQSYDELLEDIETGKRYVKVYRQMKMYNDQSLNPVLYRNQE